MPVVVGTIASAMMGAAAYISGFAAPFKNAPGFFIAASAPAENAALRLGVAPLA
jgi:hypothetical protein